MQHSGGNEKQVDVNISVVAGKFHSDESGVEEKSESAVECECEGGENVSVNENENVTARLSEWW